MSRSKEPDPGGRTRRPAATKRATAPRRSSAQVVTVALSAEEQGERLLVEHEVAAITRLSRTTRWRLEALNKFPKRVQLVGGRVAWRWHEVREWLHERTRGGPGVPPPAGQEAQRNSAA